MHKSKSLKFQGGFHDLHRSCRKAANVFACSISSFQPLSCQRCVTVQTSLDKGMQTFSQAEVGSALQIFFNLQELAPASLSSLWCVKLKGLPASLMCIGMF